MLWEEKTFSWMISLRKEGHDRGSGYRLGSRESWVRGIALCGLGHVGGIEFGRSARSSYV